MDFGTNGRTIGRYVLDIDGSLRATDAANVSPADIIALHGGRELGSALIWDRNGETIPLAAGDRVELDEEAVYLFRTSPKRSLNERSMVDVRSYCAYVNTAHVPVLSAAV